jgi:hypothetical protein
MKTNPSAAESRVESITAALVYLMTHYARTGCPGLAVCATQDSAGERQVH